MHCNFCRSYLNFRLWIVYFSSKYYAAFFILTWFFKCIKSYFSSHLLAMLFLINSFFTRVRVYSLHASKKLCTHCKVHLLVTYVYTDYCRVLFSQSVEFPCTHMNIAHSTNCSFVRRKYISTYWTIKINIYLYIYLYPLTVRVLASWDNLQILEFAVERINWSEILKKMDSKSVKVKLEGYCCKNYQPVKEHLQKMLNSGGEENVQLCVYVKDKCVVDLYGTAIGMYAVCLKKAHFCYWII